MFADTRAFNGFAVDDVEAAKRFYGETLGVKVAEGPMGILELHLAGSEQPTIVYPKEDHQPAGYTILNFPARDVAATVAELRNRGVEFKRYEGTETQTDEDYVFRGGGPEIAWFTDPAGNVLSVIAAGD